MASAKIKINLISILQINRNTNRLSYFIITFPPIILYAGVPLIKVSLAKTPLQLGQIQGSFVWFSTIRSIKHLMSAPFPPFRYLKRTALHLAQ